MIYTYTRAAGQTSKQFNGEVEGAFPGRPFAVRSDLDTKIDFGEATLSAEGKTTLDGIVSAFVYVPVPNATEYTASTPLDWAAPAPITYDEAINRIATAAAVAGWAKP